MSQGRSYDEAVSIVCREKKASLALFKGIYKLGIIEQLELSKKWSQRE